MIRVIASALRAHYAGGRLLFFLTVLGVALGVGSVVSIQLINRSAVASFEAGVDAIYGDVDLTVAARGPAFADALYPRVLATAGVARAWPRVEMLVRVEDGGPFVELKGIDLANPTSRAFDTTPGERSPFAPEPWIAVTRQLADELHLSPGDALPLLSGSRRVTPRIGALLDADGWTSLASSRVAVMDIASCQEQFDRIGELDSIDVRVADGSDPTLVAASLRASLGPTVEVLAPGEQEQRARGLLLAFRVNLTALSLISLFVGVFLVFTSVQASLVRRRREFGILRALGTTPRQVLVLILLEVSIVGALGTVLGLPLGIHAARANLSSVSTALTYVYLLDEVRDLSIPGWLPALGVLVGMLGSVLGALPPALRLSREDPRRLLSSLSFDDRMARSATSLLVVALCVLTASVALFFAVGRDWRPSGFLLGLALMIALPMICPAAVRAAARLAPARGLGVGHALRSLGQRLQTGSAAVASLAVAGSMLIGVTTLVTSFRDTVADWIDATVRADVYVATPTWPRAVEDATIDPALVERLRSEPGVRASDRLRKVITYSADARVTLIGVDFTLPGGESRYPLVDGDAREVMQTVLHGDAVLLGEPMARHLGLWTGDDLIITGRDGEIPLRVAGVYYDYSSATGNVATDLSTLARLFGDAPVNTVSLYLEDGVDVETTIDRLRAEYRDHPLTFTGNRRIRDEGLRIFDQTFLVTGILQIICLAIAACAIALTLLVQARETASETALYRAVGAQRSQVFLLYVAKGLAICVVGLALALLGGAALYWILSHVINRAYFGWTIQPSLPVAALIRQLAVIAVAVVAASLYPAAVASRTPATELSREDV